MKGVLRLETSFANIERRIGLCLLEAGYDGCRSWGPSNERAGYVLVVLEDGAAKCGFLARAVLETDEDLVTSRDDKRIS